MLDDDVERRDGRDRRCATRRATPACGYSRGEPLDAGVWGKPIACARLAEAARGDELVFMDADVRLESGALRRLSAELERSGAALLSGVPRQITLDFGERLIVPLIHFVLLGFLPLARDAQRASIPASASPAGNS